MAGDLAGGLFSSELPAERSGPARRRALVSGTLTGAAGIAVTAALTVVIWHQQAQGRSPAAVAMASEHMDNMGKFWSFPLLQASGLTGLVFAYLSVLLGLQQSARALGWLPLSYRQIDRLHRQISLLVIALVLVHVVTTALDAMGDSWKTVLIPWQWASQSWPQAVWGYTLGIIAVYLLALVAPTFYLRRLIGTGRWRFLHRFVIIFYAFSIWHALILGVDIGHYLWIRPLIWLAQIPLLALVIRRLALPVRNSTRLTPARLAVVRGARYTLIACSVIAIAAALIIATTGHSGLIATV
jgi:predicted ferric reductase